jgi:autotransporter-associated beta strand protein
MRVAAATAALATAVPTLLFAQSTTYTWNDSSNNWNSATAWNPSTAFPNDLFTDIAWFGPQAAIVNQPQINSSVAVNALSFDNSGGAVWSLSPGATTGTLTIGSGGLSVTGTGVTVISSPLVIGANQSWNIGAGAGVKLNQANSGQFSGAFTLTKEGSGTLEVGGTTSVNPMWGGYVVNGGTLLTANLNAGSAAMARSRITLGSSGSFANMSSVTGDIRIGELSGAGRVDTTAGGFAASTISQIEVLANATSGATIVSGTGTMSIRGLATQTFTGNTAGIAGPVAVAGTNTGGSGPSNGLTLAGNATLANTGNSITLRGGQLTLDNTDVNLSTRLGTAAGNTVQFHGGGALSLIGNVAGTTQNTGALTFQSGQHTIGVTVPSGASVGSQLGFNNGAANFSLRNRTDIGINFVGSGGVLGTAGTNPRIVFTGGGVPFTNTTNGMLADSSTATTKTTGWAIVNGTDWAGYNTTTGIVALPNTLRDSSNIASSTTSELTEFQPNLTVTTPSGTVSAQALKIVPPAIGQSLALGANNLLATGIMLPGSRDFSITSTTGAINGNGTRFVWVMNPATTLSLSPNLVNATNPITKLGDGILELTGSSNQINYASAANVNISGGALRVTSSSIGGFGSSGSPFVQMNFRGGVLELSGGGNFSRAVATTGATASGGIISWDGGGVSSRASGGFSAFGGDANVTLVTTIGGATPLAPIWGTTAGFVPDGYALLFGSAKADSRITLTNNIDLDNPTSYNAREIRVYDNPNSNTDIARLSGVIAGGAAGGGGNNTDLLKTGPGTLELSGNNNYTGGTVIAEGTVLASNNNALGGAINTNKAPVLIGTRGGSANAALFTTGAFTLAQNIYVPAGSTGVSTLGGITDDQSTFSGDITLAKGLTVTTAAVTGTNAVSLTGTVSGTGRITKTGGGRMTLVTGNTFTGGVTINAGTLAINGSTALGAQPASYVPDFLTIDGGALATGTGSTANPLLGSTRGVTVGSGNATVDVAASRSISFSGKVTGPGRITKVGPGTLVLGNTSNDFVGGVAVNGGVLSISSGLNLGANPVSPTPNFLVLDGGTLNWTGGANNTAPNRGVTLGSGGGTFDINSGGFLRIDGAVTGSGAFVKTGTGDLVLRSTGNNYSADTQVLNGTLRPGADDAIPTSTQLVLGAGTSNTATFDLFDPDSASGTPNPTSRNQTVAAIALATGATPANNAITNSGSTIRTFTLNAAAVDSTFAGSVSGNLNLTKSGPRALTLTGASTYTGGTAVSNGSLIVNGTHVSGDSYSIQAVGSIGGTGAITLASAKNFSLAGNVSPGASPGTLTLNTSGGDGSTTGVTDFQTGGSYTWEINKQDGAPGANWDALDLDAVAVTASPGGFTIKITSVSRSTGLREPMDSGDWDPASGEKRFVIATSSTHSFTTAMLDKFSVVTTDFGNANLGGFYLDVTDSGGNLEIVYVPEPSTGAIGAIVGAAALLRRRRRHV